MLQDDFQSIDRQIDSHEIKQKVKRYDKATNLKNPKNYTDCFEKSMKKLFKDEMTPVREIIIECLKTTKTDEEVNNLIKEFNRDDPNDTDNSARLKKLNNPKMFAQKLKAKEFMREVKEEYGNLVSYEDAFEITNVYLHHKRRGTATVVVNKLASHLETDHRGLVWTEFHLRNNEDVTDVLKKLASIWFDYN